MTSLNILFCPNNRHKDIQSTLILKQKILTYDNTNHIHGQLTTYFPNGIFRIIYVIINLVKIQALILFHNNGTDLLKKHVLCIIIKNNNGLTHQQHWEQTFSITCCFLGGKKPPTLSMLGVNGWSCYTRGNVNCCGGSGLFSGERPEAPDVGKDLFIHTPCCQGRLQL